MPLRWAVCLFRPQKGTASSLEVHPAACPAELQDQLAIRGTACLRPRGAHILYERVDDAGAGAFTPPVLIYIKRLSFCNGLEVCIKRTLITHFVGRAIREAHLQVQLSHPHLLPAYASVRGRHHYYLVLPSAEGDLWAEAEAMRQHGTGYSEEELRAVARQLLLGLEHLHSGQLAHRDIKPANLLRLPDGRVAVADFGCADGCTAGFVAAGTTQFQPPECRRHAHAQLAVLPKGYDQRSQDMWSVGSTLACLWFARMPEVSRGSAACGGGAGGLSRNNSRNALRAAGGFAGGGRGGGGSHHTRRSGSNIAVPPPPRPLPPLSSVPVVLASSPVPVAATGPSVAESQAREAAAAATATAATEQPPPPPPLAADADVDTSAAPAVEEVPVTRPPRPPTASTAAVTDASSGSSGSALPRFLAAAGFAGCGSTVGACGAAMSSTLLDLLAGLLHTRPGERLTAAQALQHPWIAHAAAAAAAATPTPAPTAAAVPAAPVAAAVDVGLEPPPSPLSVTPSGASSSSSASPSKGGVRGSGDVRFPAFHSLHYLLAHRSSAPGDAPPGGGAGGSTHPLRGGDPPYGSDTPRGDGDPIGGTGDGGAGEEADVEWAAAAAARRARRETADPDVRPEDLVRRHNNHRNEHRTAHARRPSSLSSRHSGVTAVSRGREGGAAAADGPSSCEGPSSAGPFIGGGTGSGAFAANPSPPLPMPASSYARLGGGGSGPSPRGLSHLPPPAPPPQGLPPQPPLPPSESGPSSSTGPWLRPNNLPPASHPKLSGGRREVLRVFVGAGSEASGST